MSSTMALYRDGNHYTITFRQTPNVLIDTDILTQLYTQAQENTGFELTNLTLDKTFATYTTLVLAFNHVNPEKRSAFSLAKVQEIYNKHVRNPAVPPKKRLRSSEEAIPVIENAIHGILDPSKGLVPSFFKLCCTPANLKKFKPVILPSPDSNPNVVNFKPINPS